MSLLRLALTLLALGTWAVAAASPEERQAAVQAFVDQMVSRHGFQRDSLMALMHQARFRSDIIEIIQRPAEAKPWHQYREIFLTPARIRGGVRFWRQNQALLERAAQEYGVPPEIIVAIIGVETRYGEVTGKYRVLDALATLAFGYPKRADFFRSQLEELLLLGREEHIDLATSYGSYAGAIGLPQFMPSSYRAYAVDFDGDGRRDLWGSRADVIGSVANYFKLHGWQSGEPVALRAQSTGRPPQGLIDAGMKPSLSLKSLTEQGITPVPQAADGATGPDTLVSLIRLEGAQGDEYWLGLNNFYVITRYNHSNLYAMAVYQLSREILALHGSSSNELAAR
jgi:peptidoglycan lytic transglycosylase B